MILLFCSYGFGQTDSLAVPFVAYWSIGDSYEFRITRIQKSFDGDKLEKSDSTTYFATFSVIDSTATEYLINWKYKANFTELPLEFSELLNNNNVVLDFKYKTDELGQYLGLENWQEVADTIRTKIESETAGKMVDYGGQLGEVLDSFYKNVLTKEGIEELMLTELHLFHFPFGVEFDPANPITYEDEYTNFLGDEPLRGQVEIKFEDVDYEDYFCVFTQTGKIYEEDAKSMIISLFKRLFPGEDNPQMSQIEESMKDMKYEISDDNLFAYFYYPGVPLMIETNRTVEVLIGDTQKKSIETKRIELIFDEE